MGKKKNKRQYWPHDFEPGDQDNFQKKNWFEEK